MADALRHLPQSQHPGLLVGFNKADDAGIFLINDHQALVQTVDFFPPIVDDPYYFGQIAAANALSDVYAMGGRPLTALNLVAFPIDKMPPEILTAILKGGNEKVLEAGAVVVGGHSIKDQELKFGLAVTGIINPSHIITNAGARPGDRLYLTKPLGTGIITTGIKRNRVAKNLIEKVTLQMATLNRDASEIMLRHHVHAATDITGFGLLGHACEMAAASDITIKIYSKQLPLLDDALILAEAGMIPGGANDNRSYFGEKVLIKNSLDPNLVKVLFDPQTSGGLFIAIPPDRITAFEKDMNTQKVFFRRVGEIVDKKNYLIIVE